MVNDKSFKLGNTGSAIRELFEYGNKRKKEVGAENVYDFSIGNPSVPTPKIVTDELNRLIKEVSPNVLHGYTSAAGDMGVRKAIADYLNKTYGCNEIPERIYMTCGAASSIIITLYALINDCDEVVVLAPYFPEYRVFVERSGAKLVEVKCREEDFQIDLERLSQAINKNTKVLMINSPNNPTGVVLNEESIKNIASLLKSKEKEYGHPIYILSDEPYRELIFNGQKYPFITNYYNNTIISYSFSKSLSLPGERIGYALVSNSCDNSLEVFKAICGAGRSLGYVCAPALFQHMIPNVLGYTSDLEVYKENRKLLYENLKNMGYEIASPDGAFYLFVKSLEKDAEKFSNKAKEFDLLLVPSNSFGIEGYVRIAYCVDTNMIKRSLPAFEKLMKYYKENK